MIGRVARFSGFEGFFSLQESGPIRHTLHTVIIDRGVRGVEGLRFEVAALVGA